MAKTVSTYEGKRISDLLLEICIVNSFPCVLVSISAVKSSVFSASVQ